MNEEFVYGRILEFQIIDGDSLKLRLDLGYHISSRVVCRLDGVDTPEISTPAGRAVRDYVTRWMKYYVGDCRWNSDSLDKYRRSLGDALTISSSLCLNNQLLRLKLAREYSGEKKSKWSKADLRRIERQAVEALDGSLFS